MVAPLALSSRGRRIRDEATEEDSKTMRHWARRPAPQKLNELTFYGTVILFSITDTPLMGKLIAPAILIGYLLSFGMPLHAATVDASGVLRIAEITFSADIEIDLPQLIRQVPLVKGSEPDAQLIRLAIDNLYRLNEFHYIECRSIEVPEGIRLDFRLVGKRYFGQLSLHGPQQSRMLEEALMRFYPLGEVYHPEKERQFLSATEKLLQDYGFSTASLKSQLSFQQSGRGADMTLGLDQAFPALLRTITWSGNLVLPLEHIQKTSKLRAGQPYTNSRVKEAVRQLKTFYLRRGYLTPKIELSSIHPQDKTFAVDVGINIQAGPRVEVIVEGADISQRRLRDILPIYRESSLEKSLLNEGAVNLQSEFLAKGYTSAQFTHEIKPGPAEGNIRLIYHAKLEGKQPVDKITFKGNQAVVRRDLLRWLAHDGRGISEGKYFTRLGFEAGQDRLLAEYKRLGYQQASMAQAELTSLDDGRILIDLALDEGPRWSLSRMGIQGCQNFPEADLRNQISWKEGDPFSPEQLELERKKLQEYLLNHGFPFNRVEAEYRQQNYAVEVEFQVNEGAEHRIGPVYFVGRQKTRLSALRRNIDLREGQALVVRQLFEGEQKLYSTGSFDQVRIRPVGLTDSVGTQPIVVGVREGRSRMLNFGFGFRENEGPRGLFEISHLNPGGGLRTAQLRLKGSLLNQSAVLSLRQPRPLNRNLESFAMLEASRREQVSFTEQRLGGSLQVIRDLSRVNALIFRYNYERVAVSHIPPSDVANACRASQTDGIQRQSCPIRLSSLSAAFYNDSRNDPFDPRRGAFAGVNLQVTTPMVKADAQFAKLFTQGQYYLPLPLKITITEGFRFGWAHRFGETRLLPISERFFAGGSSTLRGFGADQAGKRDPQSGQPLGGNSLLINNLEVIFPLISRLQGSWFYDTGNVFQQAVRINEFSHSLGLGLRVKTPLGPLRLEYGLNLHPPPGQSGGHFFISFGPLF